MNMKNRFGWKDKTEQEHTGGVSVTKIVRSVVDVKNDRASDSNA
jgi:hypothetical protein